MHTQIAMEWTRRIDRTSELRKVQPSAEQLLGFYEEILKVQSGIAQELAASGPAYRPETPFREQIDLGIPLRHLPALLEVTRRRGTNVLSAAAEEFASKGLLHVRSRIEALAQQTEPTKPDSEADRFFCLALLQPAAEHIALSRPQTPTVGNRCPACGALPLLAVLRPEGEGAKRSLQCSICLSEWIFRRVLCPWCGETDKERLPRYTAEECSYLRVEACDTCKHYLKSVDLTVEGHAVPLVDEVAFAALDVWATQQGFTKISQNLLGF